LLIWAASGGRAGPWIQHGPPYRQPMWNTPTARQVPGKEFLGKAPENRSGFLAGERQAKNRGKPGGPAENFREANHYACL